MAYVAGLLSPEEELELERRGWELEDCPAEWIPRNPDGSLWVTEGKRMRAVWIDADMVAIMTGPGWEPPSEESNVDPTP